MKDELGEDGNIMIKFAGLRAKTCSDLIDGCYLKIKNQTAQKLLLQKEC